MTRDSFSGYHPIVNFLYFVLVLACSMVFMHPVCLAVSLCGAISYSVYLNGRRAARFNLVYMLPLVILTVLLNPVFNHEGATILRYLPDGNPLTRESIVYGAAAAVMLVTVIAWFSCYNVVMTSDKFIYLFGRVIPALSLIFSMTLRFVPRFRAQLRVVTQAQHCIGRDMRSGSVWQRMRHGMAILSILVTWALESAIGTADSMRSRGYGLRGRTAFSIFRFDRRDGLALLFLLLCGGYVITAGCLGALYWQYFPLAMGELGGAATISAFLCYGLLCFLPLILDGKEAHTWRVLRSEI